MSMRVRELQQYLGKFTHDQKGSINFRLPGIYIETQEWCTWRRLEE